MRYEGDMFFSSRILAMDMLLYIQSSNIHHISSTHKTHKFARYKELVFFERSVVKLTTFQCERHL
jgi:hypothetical protein